MQRYNREILINPYQKLKKEIFYLTQQIKKSKAVTENGIFDEFFSKILAKYVSFKVFIQIILERIHWNQALETTSILLRCQTKMERQSFQIKV